MIPAPTSAFSKKPATLAILPVGRDWTDGFLPGMGDQFRTAAMAMLARPAGDQRRGIEGQRGRAIAGSLLSTHETC